MLGKQPFQGLTAQCNTKYVSDVKPVRNFPQGKWDANECLVVLFNMDDLMHL